MAAPRLIVVEDERIVALDLKNRLAALGYDVVATLASGEEAVQAATALHPDLVTMDIRLDGAFDGIEAAERIRTDTGVPIVFVTGYADEATVSRAKLAEPYGYVLKPFQDRELRAIIETALYRHKAVELVREQDAWLRATVSSVADGIVATDEGGRIRLMNPPAERLTGWAKEDALGVEVSRVVRIHALADEEALSGEDGTNEVIEARDGTERIVETHQTRIEGATGAVSGAVVVLDDATERHRTLEAQRFRARASALLSSSLDRATTLRKLTELVVPHLADLCVVDLVDGAGALRAAAVAHADPARAKVLEAAVREPRVVWDNLEGVGRVVRTQRAELRATAPAPGWLAGALGISREDAGLLGVQSFLSVPFVARGRTLGALTLAWAQRARRYDERDLVLAEDLGSRTAVAIDNAALYEQVLEAARMRAEILASVSHDLLAPLATIGPNVELLLRIVDPNGGPGSEGEGAARVRKHALSIQRACGQMARLVRDLLDLARIDAGHLALERQPWSVDALLKETRETFEAAAAAAQLCLEAAPAGDLEVMCDHGRVLQVLANLAGNAIKATRPGGAVTLRAERLERDVLVAVSDTGPGIPAEERPFLFDRYWQAPGASRKGLGLGLSIAKKLVEAHGGRIWLTSDVGRGTTFFFTLPAGDSTSARAPAP